MPDRAAQPAAELRRGDHVPPRAHAVTGHQQRLPYICENLGQKVFLLLPDYAFGYEQEAAYTTAIPEQSGCSVAGTAYFPLGTTDFNPFIPTIEGLARTRWSTAGSAATR